MLNRYIRAIVLIVWLIPVLLSGCSKPAEDLFDEAVVASKRGDLKKAERKLKVAVRKDPEFIHAYLQLAQVYEARGKTEEAIEAYEKSISLRPGQASALMRLASIYFEQEKFQEALDQLSPILNENAVYSQAVKVQAAQMKVVVEKIKEAKEAIDRLEDTPENAEPLSEAYYQYGKLLVETNKPQEASEFHQKALSLRESVVAKYQQMVLDNPSDASASTRLGELFYQNAEAYLMRGDVDSAVDALRRAVLSDDTQANYHFALAQLSDKQGATDREDIIALVEKAVRLDPDNPVYRFALAGFYSSDEKLEQGKAQLEKIIDMEDDPNVIARAKKHLALVEKKLAEQSPQ